MRKLHPLKLHEYVALLAVFGLPAALPIVAEMTRTVDSLPHPLIAVPWLVGLLTVLAVLLNGFLGAQWRELPRSALLMLGLACSLFGWVLAAYNWPWLAWLVLELTMAALLSVASVEVGGLGMRVLLATVLLALVQAFLPNAWNRAIDAGLIALGLTGAWLLATGGAQSRMAACQFDPTQTFWALFFVSLSGLWLGWLFDTYVNPTLGQGILQQLVGL
jgi:hypothetical protein